MPVDQSPVDQSPVDQSHRLTRMTPAADPITNTIPIACEITPAERARLVRLCLRFTRDTDIAEDLAQETLVEAWRQWHKLRDAADQRARASWLAVIATHVCHRWARRHGREVARIVGLEAPIDDTGALNWLADNTDPESELERAELLALLDKALALLPPQTRTLLLARYFHETPPAEIAARHGLSAGALSVRLHRGRLALRRLLSTTLRADAAAYGLVAAETGDGWQEDWQETRIWCPLCGRMRLRGQLDGARSLLLLRCPRCAPASGEFLDHVSGSQGLLLGIKTFKSALNRVMVWADPYYRRGVERRAVFCYRCRRTAPLLHGLAPDAGASVGADLAFHAACSCPAVNSSNLLGTALYTPEGRRFWREHPRIRLAPQRAVEAGGREAIVVGYESVTGAARIDTLFARDTFELLAIHQTPGA